jgi:hypothetical protein
MQGKRLFYIILIGLVVALALAGLIYNVAFRPSAPAIGSGVIVGYDEVTTGKHVADIDLFDKPAGASGPMHTVGYAHEGERVDILAIGDGGDSLKVRTPNGTIGWTQILFVKR